MGGNKAEPESEDCTHQHMEPLHSELHAKEKKRELAKETDMYVYYDDRVSSQAGS
jgi:hypothetical protein